jgi:DNA-binding GntR family transcriptional regulator
VATEIFTRRQTTSEAVAARLRQEMQQGLLRPGSRLRQGEVAQRLGVSTTPVREAFQLLQAQGLVRMDPHRGAVVFQPTAKDLREAYEIREVLECLAIEKAMPNITPEIVAELESLFEQMDDAPEEEWVKLNRRFHTLQYEASGRERLCSVLRDITDASNGYMYLVLKGRRASGKSQREHRQILDAIKARDVDAAQRAILRHLHQTVENVIPSLESPRSDGLSPGGTVAPS